MSKFPEIQGGGSLILAWQVKNKHVVVIGGGEVSPTSLVQLFT
jgi:precorrin-2 dehydrogenase/sirohydrochlorin ferrochelatase